ncbi:MAG: Rhodanese-related sulfurtransferase [Gammaproteobacteria bacterium]|nr:Rhodanese-related sulfurtransferase [Gammaproteobacteria bacterium]
MNQLNISGYKFIDLSSKDLSLYQALLKEKALSLEIKGSILLSPEGINLFLAGLPERIKSFVDYLKEFSEFADIWCKESLSGNIPFKRLRVRIKEEIIAMKTPGIVPSKKTAPYVTPAELKEWYQTNKDMIVLDTRNTYEYELGTFDQALTLDIETFREFPQAVSTLSEDMRKKTIVTFCTGGIRCEKAAAHLLNQGFENVWQLEGGILNYFEQCGGEYFQGKCFVFDERTAIDASLREVK